MSIECPHCGLEQQPRVVTRYKEIDYDRNVLGIRDDPLESDMRFVAFQDIIGDYWAIGKRLREECKEIFLLTRSHISNDWEIAIIIPSADVDYLSETPETVKSAIKQAKKCLAIDCSDAAAAMCRAALERMAKDKEANGTKLIHKLEDLLKRGLLTKIVYDAADKVRDWGNTALHELLEEPVDKETVKKLVTLVDLVARDLYITPMQIKSLEPDGK